MTLTCLRAGGSGIMSGASDIIPDIVTEIYVNYETEAGAAAQDRLDQIRTAMGALPWFSALKATKAWLSGDRSWRNARPAIRRLTTEEEKPSAPTSLLSACRRRKWPRNKNPGARYPMTETSVFSTCHRDCYDGCGIRVVVKDGAIDRVTGDPDHPANRGSLCGKCSLAYNGVCRDPEARLQKP